MCVLVCFVFRFIFVDFLFVCFSFSFKLEKMEVCRFFLHQFGNNKQSGLLRLPK